MSARDFTGVWGLNLGKSNIPDVTKRQILTIETDGNWVRMQDEVINDKDEMLVITVEGKFNGHDYPVTGTSFADTVAYRLIDQRTIEGIAKKDGRVTVQEIAVLSEDANSVRVTYLSFGGSGEPSENHGYFERISSIPKA